MNKYLLNYLHFLTHGEIPDNELKKSFDMSDYIGSYVMDRSKPRKF